MTRRKQRWGRRRGWIVPADASPPQELPQQIVGHKVISSRGTMPEKAARGAHGVPCLEGLSYRHVLNRQGGSHLKLEP